MSKRDTPTKRRKKATKTADVSAATRTQPLERQVIAFAEQLGRAAGTVHAKAERWTDRKTLTEQVAKVRDGAAELLKQLGEGARNISTRKAIAPGKKHRTPLPTDSRARVAGRQAAKSPTPKTRLKTNRRRGRG